jgi:hypothetical protein
VNADISRARDVARGRSGPGHGPVHGLVDDPS